MSEFNVNEEHHDHNHGDYETWLANQLIELQQKYEMAQLKGQLLEVALLKYLPTEDDKIEIKLSEAFPTLTITLDCEGAVNVVTLFRNANGRLDIRGM